MLPSVRPLMQRWSCGPVWEFADRNQIINPCSVGTMSTPGSSGLVSPTVAPYPPSTDYISDDLRPARLTPWRRPELCSFPAFLNGHKPHARSLGRFADRRGIDRVVL